MSENKSLEEIEKAADDWIKLLIQLKFNAMDDDWETIQAIDKLTHSFSKSDKDILMGFVKKKISEQSIT